MKHKFFKLINIFAFLLITVTTHIIQAKYSHAQDTISQIPPSLPYVILGGGCFWCLQSDIQNLEGIKYTSVGYSGGSTKNPTYKDITTGKSGHAEVVKIYYEPKETSHIKILDYFLTKAHNPTTLNRQWVDKGTQYRSVIFYKTQQEKKDAQQVIDAVNKSGVWQNKIVTRLEPEEIFWIAEDHHQNYYQKYNEATGNKHPREIFKPKYGSSR